MSKVTARGAAEFVALLGVVLSLVFVGFEIRQNTAAARAQAYREIGLAVSQEWYEAARDPELTEIIARATSPDSAVVASLTELERLLARHQFVGSLRLWEVVYHNVRVGALGPEAMDDLGNWTNI